MKNHIRANLLLLGLTVVLCCVLYPLVLWAVGGALFPTNASGSLVEAKGKAVGSRLIAQPFTKDEYFQPRPSAASYNATASGGSNWGANNPKLRDRVARQLGPIVKYNPSGPKKNDSVQTDIETWFATHKPAEGEKPLAAQWAADNSTLAGAWVKGDANKPLVIDWLRTHPDILADWKKGHSDAPAVDLEDDKTIPFDDIAGAFFESWAAANPNKWPEPGASDPGAKDDNGEAVKAKRLNAVAAGADLQATFFDSWLRPTRPPTCRRSRPTWSWRRVGLDPHITVRNAKYQLDRVAGARNANAAEIAKLIDAQSFTR